MNKKTTLVLAIAGILGSSVATTAQAAIQMTSSGGTGDPPASYALEIPSSVASVSFNKALSIVPPLGISIGVGSDAYLIVDLLNGAKFSGSLALHCKYSAMSLTSTSAAALVQADGNGFSTVTFQLTSGKLTTIATAANCTMSGITGLALSGLTNKSVSAVIRYNNAGDTVSGSYRASVVTFARALSPTFSHAGKNDLTIDVSQAGKRFFTATNTNTAILGDIKFTNTNTAAANQAGGLLTVASAVTSFDVKIAGAVIDAVATKYTSAVGVYLATAGDCSATSVTAATTTLGSYSGSSVTFKGVPVANVEAGVTVCISVDGETPMEKGQITATLTATAKDSFRPDASSNNNNLRKLVKNGSSDKVFVIPKPGGADAAYVRIYNTSAVTGKVLGALYKQADGSLLGSGILIDSMAPKTVAVLDSAAIATAMGVTTWDGRAWLQIDSEFQGLQTQALIRSPSGVLTDFSAGVCDNSLNSDVKCGDTQ